MTIHTLALKNFRQHEDLTINFTKGLNVIRGANESGKTTLLEAILYAWFGSTCLRDPLAEVVTWGKKETELKVSLEHEVAGVRYTFTRSKGGAECNYGDKKVVGQKEVSAFAAQLLGADAKTAGLLMMAGQATLRGALDEGPSAVSGLMSKLADFDMIDRILGNADNTLLLGNDTTIKAKLVQAESDLATLRQQLPDVSRVPELERILRSNQGRVSVLETEMDACIAPRREKTEAAYNHARAIEQQRIALAQQVAEAEQRITRGREDIAAAQTQAADRPSADEIEAATASVATQRSLNSLAAARKAFDALPTYPAVFWDQDAESFARELAVVAADVHATKASISGIEGEVKQLRSQEITNGKCPTCGQATVDPDHMARHNAEITAKRDALMAQATQLTTKLQSVRDDLQALESIDTFARRQADALQKVPTEFVSLDTSVYPPRPSWVGPVVVESDGGAAERHLSSLLAKVREADVAAGRAQALSQALEQAQNNLAKLHNNLANLDVVDIVSATAEYDQASSVYLKQATEINTLKEEMAQAQGELSALRNNEALARQRVEASQARIAEYNKDLQDLAFNNELVAKLRKLKPAITDHLWNTVLAAVSSFFSTLRGEESVVTKDGDGFKVNGRSKDSLSGSTIDVLALAIRVALTKTFIPHASLMTLDEPAHGCDLQRTSSVLGFLASIGLDQVILASHDELSESVADNIIQLSN